VKLFKLGLVLVFAGVIVAVVAVLLPLLIITHETSGVSVTGGGCIIVFFVPICFSVGENAQLALLLAVVLSIVLVVILILFYTWITNIRKQLVQVA
jgi:uncharacterized membrane protein